MVKKKSINSLDSELNIGHTKIDIERLKRRGFSESIFCLGKSLSQIEDIAESVSTINQSILFNKMSKLGIQTVKHSDRKIGSVGILTAGTSDFPVAQESYLSAKHFGMDSELITDVGVAGLHRLLSRLDIFSAKDCLIVVAGMDGALPSVVSGLVSVPVIAVPTSVGYGASFSGLGALLTMLNSCSPGVAVVNIDNGFGAAYLAAQILSRNQKR
jgi:NCAIR mutase (PurE)-related protein